MFANRTYTAPLITAVFKVITAVKDLVGGQTELDRMELAEIQTARRIVAIAMDNLKAAYSRFDELSREMDYYREVLQAHAHTIDRKMGRL